MDIQAGKGGQRPRMLMCYLCSREFGSKSLPIHIPQCQKKWEASQMAKHPKDRRPMPQPPAPEIPLKGGTGGNQAIDDFNEAAYEQFKKTLESCPFCRRKFSPEAYKHHQNACSASNPAKPAGTGLIANSLSNNKRIKAYTPPGRDSSPHKVNAVEHGWPGQGVARAPKLAPKKKDENMKEKIAKARAQKAQGGAGIGRVSFSVNAAKSKAKSDERGQSSKGVHQFCQQCGANYGGPSAKFCGACGAKRAL